MNRYIAINYKSRERERENDVYMLVTELKTGFKFFPAKRNLTFMLNFLCKKILSVTPRRMKYQDCYNSRLDVCVSVPNLPVKQGMYLCSLQQSDGDSRTHIPGRVFRFAGYIGPINQRTDPL